MSRPTVIYFDIRARAEPIRLILEEIGVAYEDKQLTGPDWPGFRGSTPFNELPLYRDGELEIARVTRSIVTSPGFTICTEPTRLSEPAVTSWRKHWLT